MFESSNRRTFQKGLDADKQRAMRRDSELSLRRKQREEHLQKRRKKIIASNTRNNNNGINGEQGGGQQQNDGPIPQISDIPKFVGMVLNTSSLELQYEGTRGIRQLLSIERDPPTARICGSGVIPKIISFMYMNNNNNNNDEMNELRLKLQFESAWVLTNIAASSTQLVSYIVKHGCIEAFVDLFRNTQKDEIIDQTIWGLGNIAGDKKLFRDRILNTGFLSDVVPKMFNLPEDMQQNTVWTISNLFRYKDPLKVCDIHEIAVVLSKLLRESKDDNIIADCMWAFVYMSGNLDEGIINYLVHQTGIINDCMRLLNREKIKYEIALHQMESRERKNQSYFIKQTPGSGSTEGQQRTGVQPAKLQNIYKDAMLKMNDKIYRPILRLIGNVLSEPDDLTQMVLDAGYLDVIEPWANHFYSGIRREIMWSFSNILAGSHQQIECLITRESLLNAIMNAGQYGSWPVKKEACWCICNAMADAITQQKKTMVEHGAIEVLASMLKPEHRMNEHNLALILEGLEGILSIYGRAGSINPYADQFEELEGLDHLERIQADDNLSENMYDMIVNLMKKYYGTDQDMLFSNINEGESAEFILNAKIDQNTNQFSFGFGGSNSNSNNNINSNNPFSNSSANGHNTQIYQF